MTIAFANSQEQTISKLEITGKLETIKSLLKTTAVGHITLCDYTIWYDLNQLANEDAKFALVETEDDQYLTPVTGDFIITPNDEKSGSGIINVYFDFNECARKITTALTKPLQEI